jgi:preprotein translocase subunit SecG
MAALSGRCHEINGVADNPILTGACAWSEGVKTLPKIKAARNNLRMLFAIWKGFFMVLGLVMVFEWESKQRSLKKRVKSDNAIFGLC